MADTQPTTKTFSKGERSIPHASQKASKYYPATDVAVPKKVRSLRQRGWIMEEADEGTARMTQLSGSTQRLSTMDLATTRQLGLH